MNEGSLGRRYAKALLSIARQKDCVALLSSQLEGLYSFFDDKGTLVQFLTNPALPNKEKAKIIEAILAKWNLHTSISHLIKLMFERKRLVYFQSVIREFQSIADEVLNQLRVGVVLPFSNNQQVDTIKNKLENITKKKVILTSGVDASLLGGVLIKIKDKLYDGSLKAQLALLSTNVESGTVQ